MCLTAALRLPWDACFEDRICDHDKPAGDGDDALKKKLGLPIAAKKVEGRGRSTGSLRPEQQRTVQTDLFADRDATKAGFRSGSERWA